MNNYLHIPITIEFIAKLKTLFTNFTFIDTIHILTIGNETFLLVPIAVRCSQWSYTLSC
jgi:hypothetical protein